MKTLSLSFFPASFIISYDSNFIFSAPSVASFLVKRYSARSPSKLHPPSWHNHRGFGGPKSASNFARQKCPASFALSINNSIITQHRHSLPMPCVKARLKHRSDSSTLCTKHIYTGMPPTPTFTCLAAAHPHSKQS